MKTALVFTTVYHRLPSSKAQDKMEEKTGARVWDCGSTSYTMNDLVHMTLVKSCNCPVPQFLIL